MSTSIIKLVDREKITKEQYLAASKSFAGHAISEIENAVELVEWNVENQLTSLYALHKLSMNLPHALLMAFYYGIEFGIELKIQEEKMMLEEMVKK